jgi:hypothetical protein
MYLTKWIDGVQLMKGKIDDNPMGKGYICN